MKDYPEEAIGTRQGVCKFIGIVLKIIENKSNETIVMWGEEGEFIIKNVLRFTKEVLPKYFKHANFQSFVRQLNKYGFNKKACEDIKVVFYNKYFCKED